MIEINNDTLILIGGLVVGIIILKLLTKFIFRIVGTAFLLIIGVFYIYFYSDFFEENKDNTIVKVIEDRIDFVSVIEYQKEHCDNGEMNRTDSIMCECIIEPLVDDLKTNFTAEELTRIEKDKKKYFKELMKALRRNQDLIKKNLKERKAIHVWNKMVRDLKKGKLVGEN